MYSCTQRVSEALVYGAWMMGQALAFAPNFGAAVLAAGRVMTLLARRPRVVSPLAPSVPDDYVSQIKIIRKTITLNDRKVRYHSSTDLLRSNEPSNKVFNKLFN